MVLRSLSIPLEINKISFNFSFGMEGGVKKKFWGEVSLFLFGIEGIQKILYVRFIGIHIQ
jgi:hypothetical protein